MRPNLKRALPDQGAPWTTLGRKGRCCQTCHREVGGHPGEWHAPSEGLVVLGGGWGPAGWEEEGVGWGGGAVNPQIHFVTLRTTHPFLLEPHPRTLLMGTKPIQKSPETPLEKVLPELRPCRTNLTSAWSPTDPPPPAPPATGFLRIPRSSQGLFLKPPGRLPTTDNERNRHPVGARPHRGGGTGQDKAH